MYESKGVDWRAVANFVFAILLGVSGWAWNTLSQDVREQQRMSNSRNERIAALETRVDSQNVTDRDLRDRLTRIEFKLDQMGGWKGEQAPILGRALPAFPHGRIFEK